MKKKSSIIATLAIVLALTTALPTVGLSSPEKEIYRQEKIDLIEEHIKKMSSFELNKEDMLIGLKEILSQITSEHKLTDDQVSALLNDQVEELRISGKKLSEKESNLLFRKRAELLYEVEFTEKEIYKILIPEALASSLVKINVIIVQRKMRRLIKQGETSYTAKKILGKNPSEAKIR